MRIIETANYQARKISQQTFQEIRDTTNKLIVPNPTATELRKMRLIQTKKYNMDFPYNPVQPFSVVLRGIVNKRTGEHYWAPYDILHEVIEMTVDPLGRDKYDHLYVHGDGKISGLTKNNPVYKNVPTIARRKYFSIVE